MATLLDRGGEKILEHWSHLTGKLQRQSGIKTGDPSSYTHSVWQFGEPRRVGNTFLTGDSAGVAIAIRSCQRAAHEH